MYKNKSLRISVVMHV